jgi:predicted DsbA family dithiol-disulfide isomerase
MISIDLFSDPICPWCFIGKRRLEAALSTRPEIEVDINWHSFQLNPMMPRDGMEREEYLALKFGNPDNARRLYDNISGVGEQAGIQFEFDRIEITPNTIAAHRLILFAARFGAQGEIVEQLFNAYFLDGRNIGDIETLIALSGEAGLNSDETAVFLESDEDVDAIKSEDMQARQLGIQGVPFYILDQQYAVSGAQEPEAFYPLFDLLLAQKSDAAQRTVGSV